MALHHSALLLVDQILEPATMAMPAHECVANGHLPVHVQWIGPFAACIPVDLQPVNGARCSDGLQWEPMVKVRQPCRRVQTRCSFVAVPCAPALPCVIRVWFVSQLAQELQSLPVDRGARGGSLWLRAATRTPRAATEGRLQASLRPPNALAPAPRALIDRPICAGVACWRCGDRLYPLV